MNGKIRPALWLTCVLLLVLVVVGPRVWELDRKSIWFDEAAAWRTASFPLPRMFESLAQNVHPPLFFVTLKIWIEIVGDSVLALRSLSVLCGVAAAVMAGVLVAEGAGWAPMFGSNTHPKSYGSGAECSPDVSSSSIWFRSGIAVALYGLSPLAVRYARESRMYTLATFLILTSAWLMLRGLRQRRASSLWGSALILTAGVYTHYYALFHCVAQGLYLVLSCRGRRWRETIPIACLPLIGVLPWLGVFLAQAERVGEEYWIRALSWERAGNLLCQLWSADDVDNGLWRAAGGVALALVCSAFCWYRGGPLGQLAALHFTTVVALAFLSSIAWKPIAMPRYLAPAHAILLCGLATAWPRRFPTAALAIPAVACLAALLLDLWPHLVPPNSRPGLRGAVAWVVQQRRSEDIVLIESPLLYVPWRYYDRTGMLFLTDAGSSRLKHYEGKPLLEPEEQQSGDARVRPGQSVWFVFDVRTDAVGGTADKSRWEFVSRHQFLDAFSWQGPVIVEHRICLDESITSLDRTRQAIELGSCHWMNIKPGRAGGLTNAKAIHDLCRDAGIPCWVGGMLESAVGTSLCIALATLDNFTYPADIFPSSRFYREDLADPPITLERAADGSPQAVASGLPGIPGDPVPDRMERCCVARAVVE